ncbi:TOBE domain-containing protein [Enemella sp. A6]|uniref:TOBE domain-containing protein n=1 Tax=Enemella sp. A6 TaxID=3440152 RepID=UPI003EBFFC15
MSRYRIRHAAALLGVSTDTVRRWIDAGRLPAETDEDGYQVVDGVQLAELIRSRITDPPEIEIGESSARNQLVGIVTEVTTDKVMAEVIVQCGPHTMVSLMSAESVRRLGLEPGVLAVAQVKSTMVTIEVPEKK